MGAPLYVVDAFTDRPFRGNPAAVCVLEGEAGEGWLADVAREMNLSETAFLVPGEGAWSLRWFTPAVEVDLCGHATLASAHVLWETGRVDPKTPLRFRTRSGELGALRRADRIELDFPAEPPAPVEAPAGLLAALGVPPSAVAWFGRNRLDFLLEIDTEERLRALTPDFASLVGPTRPGRGVIVTARSASDAHDFVSRFFAPAAGIDEDPVTGSAHCALAPYWAGRLGRTELRGYQASARGGSVGVRVTEDGRVKLTGQAVTVSRGELL